MRYLFYLKECPCVPDKCRGLEVGAAVGIGMLAGGLGSTVLTNEANADINASQLRFSEQEAEKQRRFQRDEWTRQYQIQRDEWYNQLKVQSEQQWLNYLREANYNTPSAQIQRMSEAGLNPSAVLGGQGSSGLVSAAVGNVHNAPTPSVPSGGSVSGASASAPSMIPMQNPLTGHLNALGSFIRDIAEANKNDKTVEPFVQLLGSQVIGQQLQNEWQTFQNDILSHVKDVKVKKEFQELQKLVIDCNLNGALTGVYDTQAALNKAQEALTLARKNCVDEEYSVLAFQVEHMLETWSVDMELKRSQALNSRASAANNFAQAATENEIRQFKVDNARLINEYQGFVNRMSENDADISDWTKNDRFASVTNELVENAARQGIITRQLKESLEKAINDNDYYLINHVLGPILGVSTAATVLGGAVKPNIPRIGFNR